LTTADAGTDDARSPDTTTLHRLIELVVGEPVSAEYVPLVEEEGDFGGDDPRRFAWARRPDPDALAGFRVGIIGAGLGGVCAAIRLEQAGIPFTVFDKNPDVGGTWFENTYPDLRVDVPNHFYSYSFTPNPEWSHFYARQHELHEYVTRCAKEHHVLPHVRFGTEVLAAEFDAARARWRVRVRDADGESEVEVNALISAVGMLNRPSIPDLPGLDTFAGPWFHSARWDHDVDLRDRRVAVVGTGASAMQFVPAIAPEVEQLLVFQRSRHWVTPNPDYHRRVTEHEKWLFRTVPHYLAWYRIMQFWNSADRMYPAFRADPDWTDREVSISRQNDKLRRVMTAHVERELAERPDLVADVLPDYPALGKRMLQDNGWFRTLLRDNVAIVNERVARVEPHAVVTASGAVHDVDVIILGTGFHPNKYLWPMTITGRGAVLDEHWGDDPRAHLGITVPGFPNLFCMYGPGTNLAHGGSLIFHSECQMRYITQCIEELVAGGHRSMEPRVDRYEDWHERSQREMRGLVWSQPSIKHSFFKNAYGEIHGLSPWRLVDYWTWTKTLDPADFVFA
jgi:4-hydroxyacetophenone monooxygenase